MLEVAAGDELARRMVGQPGAAVGQELAGLVVADPVVLVVVEHRQQDVEVGEQVGQPHRPPQAHREVAAVAPRGEPRVERDRFGRHLVVERLEERPAPGRRPGRAAWEGDLERRAVAASSGGLSHRPDIAVPNTLPRVTLRNDEAA